MLARAFLLDAISTALRVPRCGVCVAYWPPESRGEFEDIIFLFQKEERDEKLSNRAKDILLIPQTGGDPGERITSLANRLFVEGARKILFTCSDSPLIEPLILRAAFELLNSHKVVLGPTFDGGYYVFGLGEPYPSVFEGIDWGSDGLYRQIAEKLNGDNVNWQELELSYDVDRPEELEQLYFDIDNLRLAGKDEICYHTEKCLANLKK
jgi:glycosyltransferase A (GT-A) superfamily protein (DUF2064 family)